VEGQRSWNVSAWTDYQHRVLAGADPTAGSEQLSAGQLQLERLYLSLRTAEGLPRSAAPTGPTVDRLVAAGFANASNGALRLSPAGWLRLDEVVRVLATG
jgi:coproporphyrinogen III oxidase-like Fe-S oxidoreductase